MNLPEQVPVMSLPNAILFPRVLLPLYIFEPRYRKMLASCLHGDRMFAVGLLPVGWEKLGLRATSYPVVGVGLIRTCLGRPDGTSSLMLEGVARAEIVEYVQRRPYRVARVAALPSRDDNGPAARATLVAAVNRLAQARLRMGAEVPQTLLDSLRAIESADHLSDLISHTLLDDFHQKQKMLETLDVPARLAQLTAWLDDQIRQFELWKTLQGKINHDDVGRN